MKATFVAVLASSLLAVAPLTAGAQTHFFFGGGPTGTSDFGFKGGWGGALGFEHRIGPAASLLLRAEGGAVPSTGHRSGFGVMPLSAQELGESGPGSSPATLLSLMVGLRLGGNGYLSPYLDGLVGLGYLNDPESPPVVSYMSSQRSPADHTNVALSIGPGIALRAPDMPALFADVHYDFYSSRGASTPIIPVRIGLLIP